MPPFQPRNPDFEAAVRRSFARQAIMRTFGAELARVEPGAVSIELSFREALTQQDGFLHAGAVTTIVDSACGYAALSLMPPEARVLSVEFKLNLLAPAVGDRLIARAQVKRSGRRITVVVGDVFMRSGEEEKLIATMLATMMAVMPE